MSLNSVGRPTRPAASANDARMSVSARSSPSTNGSPPDDSRT